MVIPSASFPASVKVNFLAGSVTRPVTSSELEKNRLSTSVE